jgi:hypothetical protein
MGSFDRISWYLATGGPWIDNEGAMIRGLWVRRGHRIYLAEGSQGNGRVVRHEMLHEILDDPSHDHPLFDTENYNSRFLIGFLSMDPGLRDRASLTEATEAQRTQRTWG